MTFFRFMLPVAAVGLVTTASYVSPAQAAVDASDPGRFIDTLGDTAFATLRGGSSASSRAQFRSILSRHFAVGIIGDKLIQRHRARISPAQYAQYKAAFPGFIIGTYGDRLAPYANADIKIIRVIPRGNSAAVVTSVTRPGARAANAVWTVDKTETGYQVSNLTVGGVNLGLAQQADFDSFIQRRGFDRLVAFMKSRG